MWKACTNLASSSLRVAVRNRGMKSSVRAMSCSSANNTEDFTSLKYWVEDRVANIQLNRPKRLNAISMKMPTELSRAVEMANFDSDVKVPY